MVSRPCCEGGVLRVLVADSRPDVRSALKLLLEQDAELVVSAEARTGDDVLEQVRVTCPDVIILDCDLPGVGSGELLQAVRAICPRAWVVALCARWEVRQAALSAGADAFVSKADSPQTLVDAVRHRFGLRASKPPAGNPGRISDALGSPSGGCHECERGKGEEG